MLFQQSFASARFLQICIDFVEQRHKFFHFAFHKMIQRMINIH